jgi:hypothetical protein
MFLSAVNKFEITLGRGSAEFVKAGKGSRIETPLQKAFVRNLKIPQQVIPSTE